MSAPLCIQRLAHQASLNIKYGLFSKCLVLPFGQRSGSRESERFSCNETNEKRLYTTQHVCTTQLPLSLFTCQLRFQSTLQHVMFEKYCMKNDEMAANLNASCFLIQRRQYGRKVKPKPQKITNFEYSGDLRTLPEIDKNTILYPYVDLEDDMDEIIKKLTSFDFASVTQQNKHLKQVVQDRIIQLFGADSEIEQEIARLTLRIRQMIPYCIRIRTDKGNKIWLLKTIFRRRRLLTKLRHMDHERFEWLLRELKIRYVIPRDREEFKGWKHNLREATKEEKLMEQRRKLEEFRDQLKAEKEEFYEQKAKIMAEIEKDMDRFGLGQDFLDSVLVKERDRKKPHKILNWEERVKLGMTGKIKEYYG